MNTFIKLLMVVAIASLTACQSWDNAYNANYQQYISSNHRIAAESKAVIDFPNGAEPGTKIVIPTNPSVRSAAPVHPGDVYSDYFTAGVNAAATLGAAEIRARADRRNTDSRNETSVRIAEIEAESQADDNAVTRAFIESNTDATGRLIELLTPDAEMGEGNAAEDPAEPADTTDPGV